MRKKISQVEMGTVVKNVYHIIKSYHSGEFTFTGIIRVNNSSCTHYKINTYY